MEAKRVTQSGGAALLAAAVILLGPAGCANQGAYGEMPVTGPVQSSNQAAPPSVTAPLSPPMPAEANAPAPGVQPMQVAQAQPVQAEAGGGGFGRGRFGGFRR
jgi:hypothetical protein